MSSRRPLLFSLLRNRCPACREGRLFRVPNPYRLKTMNEMHPSCRRCGADFEREPGFYFGAAYVSYALTVALWVAVLVALYTFGAMGLIVFTGFFDQPELFLISGISTLLLLLPPIQRLSRSIWIHLFLRLREASADAEQDSVS